MNFGLHMRSRVGQSILLIVLTVLLGFYPRLSSEAQTNNRAASLNGFRTPYRPLVASFTPSEQWRQLQSNGPVIVNTELVTLNVSVLDHAGRSIIGLDKHAFTILEDKSSQEITFFSDADEPISVTIVFDVSGSMSSEKIKLARQALSHFIETSLNSDEYSLIVFNERPQLLVERTHAANAMLDRLSTVVPHGATALYDACYLAVERLTRGAYSKRAVLLISDGQDNKSHYDLDEVRHLLSESDVMLYSIGIAAPIELSGKPGSRVRRTMEGLAEITGGRAFFVSKEAQMDEVFDRIALELRHQYSIAYRPTNFSNDRKWHRIKVKVVSPNELEHPVRSQQGRVLRSPNVAMRFICRGAVSRACADITLFFVRIYGFRAIWQALPATEE
jgi:Ca-activated chloride channel family protein